MRMTVRLLIILQWLAARVPVGAGNWIADRGGDLIGLVARRSRCAALSNMRHVLGPDAPEREVRRAVRGVFRNVVRNYYDLLRVGSVSDADLDRMMRLDQESLAVVQKLAAEGHGILLVTPHWGAFDMVTQVLNRQGLPILMLVAHFRPAAVAEFLNRLRGQRGSEVVWIDEGLAALKKAM